MDCGFQNDAFQQDAFQNCQTACGFQADAFQNDAFQMCEPGVVVADETIRLLLMLGVGF